MTLIGDRDTLRHICSFLSKEDLHSLGKTCKAAAAEAKIVWLMRHDEENSLYALLTFKEFPAFYHAKYMKKRRNWKEVYLGEKKLRTPPDKSKLKENAQLVESTLTLLPFNLGLPGLVLAPITYAIGAGCAQRFND